LTSLKGPIIVDQWLPNKPPSKRVIYHRINSTELTQNEIKYPGNRYIEYKKPHTRIELEIIRLPIITMNPKDYRTQSTEFHHHNFDFLRWRI
jgi:hypothetical protein